MLNKLEKDRIEHRDNYFREIFRSKDLYRQLGEIREDYEERARRYNEDKIEDEQAIYNLFRSLTLPRMVERENKHIIES